MGKETNQASNQESTNPAAGGPPVPPAARSFASTIRPQWIAILAVVITAMVLRPAATAIGPVLAEIKTDLGISSTIAGLLTALPGLSFALVGLTANRLTPRFGLVGALLQASVFVTVGATVRALTGSWALFLVFSFVALAGMAIGNVLLPAFIKSSFPHSSAKMATVYTTCLSLGAILPTVFGNPLSALGGSLVGEAKGWRLAVGIWAVLGLLSLIMWLFVRAKCSVPNPSQGKFSSKAVPLRQLFRSPTAVGLMIFFGTQSMQAYIQFGWAAQAYRDGGLDARAAGLMVTIIALGGVPGGLLMPRLVAKRKWLKTSIITFSSLLVVGYLGIALAPTTVPWLWAVALSISGFCFPTALALIIERTKSSQVTSAVSGFVQPVGYFLAALGPFLVGYAFEAIGSWQPILYVLAATAIVMAGSGLLATRPRMIDDELPTSDAPR